ncbi:secretion protein HlyD [Neptunitalea chrysea]|uniref:Secretion protein HlyD n=1 Tax=Neptunitalea chrysea TaxID=1647581 RepID=A0A9W6EU42_9FLAO|nr:HlyD family secretion protein [Neptunitalea chrysea]GLB52114.1 secretion protein HlyD [Neptunitalea chrysea]
MEQKKKTNKKFIIIISVMVFIGLVYGGYTIINGMAHETTDDAQIEANMNPIIPRVAGYIQKVYVTDNQKVFKGDTLFVIQDDDYEVQVAQARANLAAAESQLLVAEASINASNAGVQTSTAQVNSAQGNIESAKIRLWRATNDYERYKDLYEKKSITKQQFEQADADKQEAEKALEVLQNQQKASSSQRYAAVTNSDIAQKKVAVAQANVESATAQLNAAILNRNYTIVTAPIEGQLSAVELQPGQFVSPGQALFYLVNTTDKWVVANFKETQLEKLEVGQTVTIEVDAFPKETFMAKVTAFSPATGAKFSLLPPNNATGNFVKTIQRLPVKISFTSENNNAKLAKLRAGMNVVVDVHLK